MWGEGKDGKKGEPVSLPWPSAGYLPTSSQLVVSKKLHSLFLFRGKEGEIVQDTATLGLFPKELGEERVRY